MSFMIMVMILMYKRKLLWSWRKSSRPVAFNLGKVTITIAILMPINKDKEIIMIRINNLLLKMTKLLNKQKIMLKFLLIIVLHLLILEIP